MRRSRRGDEWCSAALFLLGIAALAFAAGCFSGKSPYELGTEARHAAATLQTSFSRAVDAADRTVMADTDARSKEFVLEAQTAREAVVRANDELTKLLRSAEYTEELKLLEEFRAKFAAYEALDQSILGMAVENTNLKAMRLSFGPSREAAESFRVALRHAVEGDAGVDMNRGRTASMEALLAVREIQALQAPHIAEAKDDRMTAMELEMQEAETSARRALSAVSGLVAPGVVEQLTTELNRFLAINAEIVALSRRNTNVRTLELTLGHKRTVVATCEESLRALSDSLTKRVTGPRRSQ